MELTVKDFLLKTGYQGTLLPGEKKLVKHPSAKKGESYTLLYDWQSDKHKIRVSVVPGLDGKRPAPKELAEYTIWLQTENYVEMDVPHVLKEAIDQLIGRVTGGKWLGHAIVAGQHLAYGMGLGTGAVKAAGGAVVEGLMASIEALAKGKVSLAQRLGSYVARGSGIPVHELEGLQQIPFADIEAPALGKVLSNAFSAGSKKAQKEVLQGLAKIKGTARNDFSAV